MAIVALVLAFLPLGITWIVAIVLAIVVLIRARSGKVAGAGMAIGAIVVSVLSMVAATALIVFLVQLATKYDDAREAGSGVIWVDMLRAGDCMADIPDEDTIGEIRIVQCERPHEGEVFAVFSIDAGTDPTQDHIDDLADEGCDSRFEEFVGVSFDETKLDGDLIRPTPDDIDENTDVICYISDPAGPTTGSLAGAKR
jgi:hypothetical protein